MSSEPRNVENMAFAELLQCDVVELGHVLGPGMPRLGAHPGYLHAVLERHGEHPSDLESISHANDLVSMGLHTGSHMDAIGHISRRGELHGGVAAEHLAQGSGPLASHGADELAPYILPGVLFDVARRRGVDALDPGDEVAVEDLADSLGQQEIPDRSWCALIRTGWGAHFSEGRESIYAGRRGGMPGVRLDGARWLADRGATVVGGDTAGFEAFPADDWYVHAFLLVDRGIPIMENLDLEALAQRAPSSFIFLGLPLRIRGGTAGPMRPIALIRGDVS